MPTKNLVIHEGQLAEKTVVETHQVLEEGQLEREHNDAVTALENVRAEQVAVNARVAEAEAAEADTKSNFERGQALVAEQSDAGADSPAEDGAEQPSADGVEIPVTQL